MGGAGVRGVTCLGGSAACHGTGRRGEKSRLRVMGLVGAARGVIAAEAAAAAAAAMAAGVGVGAGDGAGIRIAGVRVGTQASGGEAGMLDGGSDGSRSSRSGGSSSSSAVAGAGAGRMWL